MKQLDPRAVWLFFINFVLRWISTVVILSIYGWAVLSIDATRNIIDFLNWLWIIVPTLLVLCFIWAKLTYHFYRYELTDTSFRKERGVIYKKYVSVPYDRIQNVDVYRGILDRILGLSDLNIQTAGMSGVAGSEGRLPALSQKTAEQLRDELIQRTRQTKNQGL